MIQEIGYVTLDAAPPSVIPLEVKTRLPAYNSRAAILNIER